MNGKLVNQISALLLGLAVVIACVERAEYHAQQVIDVQHVSRSTPAAMPVINLPKIDESMIIDLKNGVATAPIMEVAWLPRNRVAQSACGPGMACGATPANQPPQQYQWQQSNGTQRRGVPIVRRFRGRCRGC